MEERLKYCQACLSTKRKLYPVAGMYKIFQQLCFWEINLTEGGLCWECRRILIKFSRFKIQVKSVQDALYNCDLKNTDLKCLSNLSYTTLTTYIEYSYTQDPLNGAKTDVGYNTDIKVEACDVKSDEDVDFDDHKEECEPDIYAEVLDTKLEETILKLKIKKPVKQKKKKIKIKVDNNINEEDLMKKFSTVILSEEDMLKYREEKRNQPNYMKLPYKCDGCVLGFTKKENYDFHLEKKHNEKIGPYTCPTCSIRFSTQKHQDCHRKKHYRQYKCNLCKYETSQIKTAWSHCRSKHPTDSEGSLHCQCCQFVAKYNLKHYRQYKCNLCKYQTSKIKTAWSHCRSKHPRDSEGSLHCQCCQFVAHTPEELSNHLKADHSVFCNECGEKFKGPETLKSHKRRIHNGIKREFKCDICTKAFKTKSRLESHMANHNSTIAQKLAYCATCNIQYKNIYVYRNHLRTSANHADQMYQCRECNKNFASKVYWKKHYNFYHLHKSQYRCDLCNKLFISQWRLKNHKSTQHGLSRSRDHHCNVCGKQFFTLSTLKGHQLTHSEQRSFMCEDCGDTFKQRPALYTHYKLVHRGMKRKK